LCDYNWKHVIVSMREGRMRLLNYSNFYNADEKEDPRLQKPRRNSFQIPILMQSDKNHFLRIINLTHLVVQLNLRKGRMISII
jgi:hypothetical protein